ncbi:MAG: NYN domain-containing protein [Clostridiales bacterium]|nr:NYN domain-containing protein [Clostridiales bacterium]
MLEEKNIAFFIDVDNCGLTSEHYADIINKLSGMGRIFYGRVYGAGQRKHKEIYADANEKGYEMMGPMRVKRRGRKDFDSRIFVDVVDAVRRAPSIKIVCIVAQPTDLVHLYTYLHKDDIKIIALANGDEASNSFIDEVLDLGTGSQAKAPKKPAAKPAPKAKVTPVPAPIEEPKKPAAAANSEVDRTEELLREIERLKALASEEQTKPVEEEPVKEESAPAPKAEPTPAPAEEPAPVKEPAKPRTQYAQNDSDLVRRIEELRRNNEGGDSDELLEEIKKLLDTVD